MNGRVKLAQLSFAWIMWGFFVTTTSYVFTEALFGAYIRRHSRDSTVILICIFFILCQAALTWLVLRKPKICIAKVAQKLLWSFAVIITSFATTMIVLVLAMSIIRDDDAVGPLILTVFIIVLSLELIISWIIYYQNTRFLQRVVIVIVALIGMPYGSILLLAINYHYALYQMSITNAINTEVMPVQYEVIASIFSFSLAGVLSATSAAILLRYTKRKETPLLYPNEDLLEIDHTGE